MEEFEVDGGTAAGYLGVPQRGHGPAVLVLHAWWGLTPFFKSVCDRLASEGFVALAPDRYGGLPRRPSKKPKICCGRSPRNALRRSLPRRLTSCRSTKLPSETS